ncbi:flagellar protein FliT [Pseudomonas daroniae]|uniref:Flagellar protein FliT n=1 Tax=Phytopseudomonas daroniae TaxID=2487519 RepID=A0A4Q9QR82_9GAMM|nr:MULTISPECIES: flagellar protein FliT [Pseudomonas]TBU77094.1 flagellar protein FliT [Pseudomonas daroniae]TBU83375.1 flagellar protein FliT [Pseudomonas daroniae]TBU85014.1 flagellar protein FliT [Pseudomonas sp. FRB 228]TBU93693.1 flagellar protein FliT [Pseudomonas daroniae]
MTSAARKLEITAEALRSALLNEDWAAVGELDLRCRSEVDEAMAVVGGETELKRNLESLLHVYRDLVSACQVEKAKTGAQILQMKKGQQGAKLYQLFG